MAKSHPGGLVGGVGIEEVRTLVTSAASAHPSAELGRVSACRCGRGGVLPSHLPMAEGDEVDIAHVRNDIEADPEPKANGGVGVLPVGGGGSGGGRPHRRGDPAGAAQVLRPQPAGIGHGPPVAHVDHELGPVADEVLVVEGARPTAAGFAAEAPSVELPDEGFVLSGFEITREDLGGQVERLGDDEGLAAGEPLDHLLGFGEFEDLPELCRFVDWFGLIVA